MNKKGFWFNIGIAIVIIIILVYSYNAIGYKYSNLGKQIGERQVSVMEAYREGENAVQYMDRAAKASIFALYNKNSDSIDKKLFENKFTDLLNSYSYHGVKIFDGIKFNIVIENFDSIIVSGVGDKTIKIPTICNDEQISDTNFYYDFLPEHYGDMFDKACGVYTIRPVFRVEVDKKIWEG